MSKKTKNQKHKAPKRARTADKHVLYEQSVQNTETDVEFLEELFKQKERFLYLDAKLYQSSYQSG